MINCVNEVRKGVREGTTQRRKQMEKKKSKYQQIRRFDNKLRARLKFRIG